MPHTQNQERDVSLPILAMSGPGKFSRVEQNEAASSTPGGALPAMPFKVSALRPYSPQNLNTLFSRNVLKES